MYLAHRIGDAWLHLALPSPVNNVHSHRFKLLFVLQLFFCFRFALDTKHAAFAPLCCTCTCEESNSMDTSVRERDYVLVPPVNPFPYAPTVVQDEIACPTLFYHHQRPIPGYFGISCVYLLVVFEVFLQWILANEKQEAGICLHHETAVQLSCESVVVSGTV